MTVFELVQRLRSFPPDMEVRMPVFQERGFMGGHTTYRLVIDVFTQPGYEFGLSHHKSYLALRYETD